MKNLIVAYCKYTVVNTYELVYWYVVHWRIPAVTKSIALKFAV